jgi:hypothetical protein
MAGCKESVDLEDLLGSGRFIVSADFLPDGVPPGVTHHHVALQKSAVSRNLITLDVIVTEVSEPVSGIAIKLTYDPTVAEFIGCSDGMLFQPGTCHASENPQGSGEVFIGRSITAPETAISVTGSRTIVHLMFGLLQPSSTAIVFEAQNLGGGDATALLDANGDPILVDWFEGRLVGR